MNRQKASAPQITGLLWVVLGVTCLSAAPILIKVGLAARIDPIPLLAVRLAVASAVLWVGFILFRPRYLKIDGRGLLGCLAVGGSNAASLLLYYLALTRIDASIAHVVFSLFPLLALLMLATRGEKITRLNYVRLGMGLIGIYFLIGPGGVVDSTGVLMVIGTAFFYALHLNLIQWYLRDYPPQTIAIYVVSAMTLIVGLLYIAIPQHQTTFSAIGWGVILGAGIVSTAIARVAMFTGVQRIGSGQTALLGSLETLLVVLWALLFLRESLSPLQASGGFLILTSAALAVRPS